MTTPRIELNWPGKDLVPIEQDDGSYSLSQPNPELSIWSAEVETLLGGDRGGSTSLVLDGDRLDALDMLKRFARGRVQLAYLDLPRIDIDDQTDAFRGESERRWSTWMSMVRAHVRSIVRLMSQSGVVAVNCSDSAEPYVRLILQEALGRSNYVGTVMWQRHYAPRMIPNQRQFTATHDPIVVFAADISELPPVALEREPVGYRDDGDPRGPSKAEHKGARKDDYTYETHVPPYRWALVGGDLPPGIWRVSPMSGAIWGIPKEVGSWTVSIEVTDSDGNCASADLMIETASQGQPPDVHCPDWLWEGLSSGGQLRVTTASLPMGVIGRRYTATLEAEGGSPHVGTKKPGSGRYWEFAPRTLEEAIGEDRASFGQGGDAIPAIKRYLPQDEKERLNIQSLWLGRNPTASRGDLGVGYTQDATKHLKSLKQMGLIDEIVTTSKPEALLAQLLDIFTDEGDLVLECFSSAADLSAVAAKKGRVFLNVAGDSSKPQSRFKAIGLRRIAAVLDGLDIDHPVGDGVTPVPPAGCIAGGGQGTAALLRLTDRIATRSSVDEYPMFTDYFRSLDTDEMRAAILLAEGFLPVTGKFLDGLTFDGGRGALFVEPGKYLTQQIVGDAAEYASSESIGIDLYYFRSTDDAEVTAPGIDVRLRRLPMDVTL